MASVPIAPTPLRFGPILPPVGPIRWQAWQSAAVSLPRAASPGCEARARFLTYLVSSNAASSGVSTGGKSLDRIIFEPACALPQSPDALEKRSPGVPAGRL